MASLCCLVQKTRQVQVASARRFSSSTIPHKSILGYAERVISERDPLQKVRITHEAWGCIGGLSGAELLKDKLLESDAHSLLPIPLGILPGPKVTVPGRPAVPILVDPKNIPSNKEAGVSLPAYLLHQIAHVEINAIDLAWSTCALPPQLGMEMPLAYYIDWLRVAWDESNHFEALYLRLQQLGTFYGAVPSHNNLWEAAVATDDNLLARLAIVPLVQEARGLDAGPRLISRLVGAADVPSSKVIQKICEEEVLHVGIGVKWFKFLCRQQNLSPKEEWQRLVQRFVTNPLPGPFNHEARQRAQLADDWYLPLSDVVLGKGSHVAKKQ